MSGKFKAKISTLNLVHPPVSNRIASLAKDDEEFSKQVSQSDFYMIAARPNATFSEVKPNQDDCELEITISVAGGPTSSGKIVIEEIPEIKQLGGDELDVRIHHDQEFIYISIPLDVGDFFTMPYSPESVLTGMGRKQPHLIGFDNFIELSTYDLLYVGIAKVGDTFQRLLNSGHEARLKILSEEPQRFPGAHISDEIYLFPFIVNPLTITSFGTDPEDIEDEDFLFVEDRKRVVADAEKAFVSLLKPPYNRQLFANYPKGTDGLYAKGLRSYSYSIAEGVRFRTAWGDFNGAREHFSELSNDADSILVIGDDITVYNAEVRKKIESGEDV